MHNLHVHNKTIKGDLIFTSILHIMILKRQERMRLSCTNLKNMPIIAVKLLQRKAFTQQPPAKKNPLASPEDAHIYTPIRDLR